VRSAISEFDRIGRTAFLDKYGFGPAREYMLVDGGNQYDSKAICGAAHGYDLPDLGPLRATDFSGGQQTVERKLRALGFEVQSPERPGKQWTPEERALALQLYLRHGMLNKTHPLVAQLSEELNERAFHPEAGTRSDFRNPAGVALKLANFAALDPSYPGAGMSRTSAGDLQTWDEYSGDEDALDTYAAVIRSSSDAAAPVAAAPVERRELERNLTRTYTVAGRLADVEAERREAALVDAFATWLKSSGTDTSSHHYAVGASKLRCDLFDEDAEVIWEAKAEVGRFAVRLAIGQLLDYRRFEPDGVRLGVLLPRRPSDDLLALIGSVPAIAAWPTGTGGFVLHGN
jgi:5-methylcytosine-specific restriction protein A